MNFKILKRKAFEVLVSFQKFNVIFASRFPSADPLRRRDSEQPFNQILRFRSHLNVMGPLKLQIKYFLEEPSMPIGSKWVFARMHPVDDTAERPQVRRRDSQAICKHLGCDIERRAYKRLPLALVCFQHRE